MKERSVLLGKWLLYIAIFITPLIFWKGRVYPHITSKVFFFEGLAILMLLNWVFLMLISPEYRLNKKTYLFLTPIFLFVFWLTIASILGPDSTTAFWGYFMRGDGMILWYSLISFLLVLISFTKVHGRDFLVKLFKISFISSLLVTLSVWFNDDHLNLFNIFKGSDSIGNQSFTGPYLLFNIFIGLFLFFDNFSKNKNKYFNLYTIGIVFILTSPIFFSFKNLIGEARGAILGLALSVVFGALVFFSLSKKKLNRIFGYILIAIFVFSCIFTWNKLLNSETKLHKGFIEQASSSRFLFWDVAREGIKQSPIFGFGKEGYRIMFQQNFRPDVLLPENNIEGFVDRAHNIIMDIGVWGGYPAVISYYLVLVSIIIYSFFLFYRGIFSRQETTLISSSIFGYFIQNLFVFDNVLTLMMFFVVIGSVIGLLANNENLLKDSWVLKNGRIVVLFIFILIFIFIWFFIINKPVKKAKLMYQIYNAKIPERPALYKNLLDIHPMGDMYDVGDFSQYNYRIYTANKDSILGDLEKKKLAVNDLFAYLEYGDKVFSENPYNYQLVLNLARLGNVLLGFLDPSSDTSVLVQKIFEWEEKAKKLSPKDPQVYWALGQTNIFVEKFDKAIENFEYSINLEPRIDWAHGLLIRLAHHIGDKKLFDESYKKAKEYFPDFNIEIVPK